MLEEKRKNKTTSLQADFCVIVFFVVKKADRKSTKAKGAINSSLSFVSITENKTGLELN